MLCLSGQCTMQNQLEHDAHTDMFIERTLSQFQCQYTVQYSELNIVFIEIESDKIGILSR